MQLHQIKRSHKNKTVKRVGRGGTRGKTSGRGHKGQKAHGNKAPRPELRDIIKKLPKRRGYGKNRARTVNPNVTRPVIVNISTLESLFSEGESVTPKSLVEKGAIGRVGGRIPQVKILGKGKVNKKLTVSNCLYSEKAHEELTKSGTTIE
jgi:large subunit ribosomal protein L15